MTTLCPHVGEALFTPHTLPLSLHYHYTALIDATLTLHSPSSPSFKVHIVIVNRSPKSNTTEGVRTLLDLIIPTCICSCLTTCQIMELSVAW